ncbi:hypothetical protein EG329_008795 [Mollisiaceae sp. DMI_Dod_QoI]|nr:hypothetical protein EG329_008795 [Helotiales sp. DMI_Dod_QoI]
MEVTVKVDIANENHARAISQAGPDGVFNCKFRKPTLVFAPVVEEPRQIIGREIYIAEIKLDSKGVLNAFTPFASKTFHRFPKLSLDIQNKIFEMALPAPRTIQVNASYNSQGTGLEIDLDVHPIATALLHVNRRARDIARSRYKICFEGKHCKPIYISWSTDTVYFETPSILLAMNGHDVNEFGKLIDWMDPEWIKKWQEKVQNVAFVQKSSTDTILIGRQLAKMGSLKNITIVQDASQLDRMGPYERYLVSRRYLIKEAVMKPWIDKWVGSSAVEKFEMQIKAKKSVHDFPHRLLCLISRKAGCSAKDVEDSKKELGIEDYAEMKLFPKVDFERKGVLFIKSHLTQLSKEKHTRWAEFAVLRTRYTAAAAQVQYNDLLPLTVYPYTIV